MSRRKTEIRCLGPYPHAGGFRIIEVAPDGSRARIPFDTEAQALAYQQAFHEARDLAAQDTEGALEEYLEYLTTKGNKPGSRVRTAWSIRTFFPVATPLLLLSKKRIRARYKELTKTLQVDSHRNALAELKTFFSWCAHEDRKYLKENVAAEVSGEGKRNKRKPQLKRVKDARAWYRKACELAERGDEGAIAALLTLVFGPRASEIILLRTSDIDEDVLPADLIHIPGTKTEAADRGYIEVPEPIRGYLAALIEGKGRDALLFPTKKGRTGHHYRDWPCHQVQRICDLADVPRVTAHGMRGLNATIALRRGAAAAAVAAELGHEDVRTTHESYAAPGAAESAARKAGFGVLTGGKK